MPRPGPRRPLVAFRLGQPDLEALDERAACEAVDRSEMLRRMVAYALAHMPVGNRRTST